MKKKILIFVSFILVVLGLSTVTASKYYNFSNIKKPKTTLSDELVISTPNVITYYKLLCNDNKYGIIKSMESSSNINYDNLSEEDILKLNDFNNYSIFDDKGNMYKIENNIFINEKNINNEVLYFSFCNDDLQVILKYEGNNQWTFYYATVEVITGINHRFYLDLNEAFKNIENNSVINLMSNQELFKTLNIKNSFILNGNGYKIQSNDKYLFNVDKKINSNDVIYLSNLDINVKSFIKFNKKYFKKMYVNNCSVSYKVLGIEKDYKKYFELGNNTIFSLPLN